MENAKTYTAGCSFDKNLNDGAIVVVDNNGYYRMCQRFRSKKEFDITKEFLQELGCKIIEEKDEKS